MGKAFSAWYTRPGRWANRKWLWRVLLLTAGVVAPLAQCTRALADDLPAIPCRSDPVLVVNGAVIDLQSTLWADQSAISELDYQVTVPSGALLGSIRLTVGLGFPEVVTYVVSPDQPWGSVRIDASVRTTQDGVAAFPLSVQASALLAGSATSNGTSDDTTTVTLQHLLML